MAKEKALTITTNKWTLPIILGIVIMISLTVVVLTWGTTFTSAPNHDSSIITGESVQDIEPKEICSNVQVPYEEQEEYLKTEYYTETIPYTDKECETKDLPYSVDNTAFDYNTCNQQEDLCIEYFLGICTEKKTYCIDRSASCSLDLRNLDGEESGTWTIKHLFLEQGTSNVIKTSESSIYLYPQTSKRVSGQIRITSQGETGDANKNIGSCNYQVLRVPTKQVCRDVIKYKDIQKERQVTAYRPVIKYRIERKCE